MYWHVCLVDLPILYFVHIVLALLNLFSVQLCTIIMRAQLRMARTGDVYDLANSDYVPFSTMQLQDPPPRAPHCACSYVQVGSMHVYMHVHPWQVTRMVMPSKHTCSRRHPVPQQFSCIFSFFLHRHDPEQHSL